MHATSRIEEGCEKTSDRHKRLVSSPCLAVDTKPSASPLLAGDSREVFGRADYRFANILFDALRSLDALATFTPSFLHG